MKYIIHTCRARLWYVNQFLKPSLTKQGIRENDIIIWLDKNNLGNLRSFLNSLIILPNEDYIWHLQDDIIICSDFKERTEKYDKVQIHWLHLISLFMCVFTHQTDCTSHSTLHHTTRTENEQLS